MTRPHNGEVHQQPPATQSRNQGLVNTGPFDIYSDEVQHPASPPSSNRGLVNTQPCSIDDDIKLPTAGTGKQDSVSSDYEECKGQVTSAPQSDATAQKATTESATAESGIEKSPSKRARPWSKLPGIPKSLSAGKTKTPAPVKAGVSPPLETGGKMITATATKSTVSGDIDNRMKGPSSGKGAGGQDFNRNVPTVGDGPGRVPRSASGQPAIRPPVAVKKFTSADSLGETKSKELLPLTRRGAKGDVTEKQDVSRKQEAEAVKKEQEKKRRFSRTKLLVGIIVVFLAIFVG